MPAPTARLIALQAGIASLIWLYVRWVGADSASVLAAAGCVIVPNLWLAIRLARTQTPVLFGLVSLQVQRLVLTAALFVISFIALPDLDPIVFFITFISCQTAFIIVLLWR